MIKNTNDKTKHAKFAIWYAVFGQDYKKIFSFISPACLELLMQDNFFSISSDGLSMDQDVIHNQNISDITHKIKMNMLSYEGNDVRKHQRLDFIRKNEIFFSKINAYSLLNFDTARLILESYLHKYIKINASNVNEKIISTSDGIRGITGKMQLTKNKVREFGDYTFYQIEKYIFDKNKIPKYQYVEKYVVKYKENVDDIIPNIVFEDHSEFLYFDINTIFKNAISFKNCFSNCLYKKNQNFVFYMKIINNYNDIYDFIIKKDEKFVSLNVPIANTISIHIISLPCNIIYKSIYLSKNKINDKETFMEYCLLYNKNNNIKILNYLRKPTLKFL